MSVILCSKRFRTAYNVYSLNVQRKRAGEYKKAVILYRQSFEKGNTAHSLTPNANDVCVMLVLLVSLCVFLCLLLLKYLYIYAFSSEYEIFTI